MGIAVQRGNTSVPLKFLLVQSGDHITGATGLTPTVTISKNLGSPAAPTGTIIETSDPGVYALIPSVLDVNTLGELWLHATATGADPRDSEFSVVDYNPSLVLPSSPPTTATFGTIRASDIILEAFDDLGIGQVGETRSAAEMQDALRRLNGLCDGFNLQPGWLLNEQREVFNLVSGQGTPANPYTMGPGGDFDTVRPVWLNRARLQINTTTIPTEIDLALITDQSYESINQKTFQSNYPQLCYFNSTQPLATIYLYPVPTTDANPIVLYSYASVPGFTNLTMQYTLAPGYREALHYNLAKRLAQPYGMAWTPELNSLALNALRWIKIANTKMMDVSLDPALVHNARRPFNILAYGPQ
jgi:hypothetical protein